ncbi:MAG: hypothetical protein RL701_4793 [Pseudomonadota bacterium]
MWLRWQLLAASMLVVSSACGGSDCPSGTKLVGSECVKSAKNASEEAGDGSPDDHAGSGGNIEPDAGSGSDDEAGHSGAGKGAVGKGGGGKAGSPEPSEEEAGAYSQGGARSEGGSPANGGSGGSSGSAGAQLTRIARRTIQSLD